MMNKERCALGLALMLLLGTGLSGWAEDIEVVQPVAPQTVDMAASESEPARDDQPVEIQGLDSVERQAHAPATSADAVAAAEPDPVAALTPAPSLTVRFVAGGSSWTLDVGEGEPIPEPGERPDQDGSAFVHWYDAAGSELAGFTFGAPARRNMTLVALFRAVETQPEAEQVSDIGEQRPQPESAETAAAVAEAQPAPQPDEFAPAETILTDAGQSIGEGAIIEDELSPRANGVLPGRSVTVTANLGATVRYGDTVVLTGSLDGYGEVAYGLQWQVDEGGGWRDLPGAQGAQYAFTLSAQNYANRYRLAATVVNE